MDFSSLPTNVAAALLKNHTYDEIMDLCKLNQAAQANLCKNNNFWDQLFLVKYPNEIKNGLSSYNNYLIKEFGTKPFLTEVSWKLGDNIFLLLDKTLVSDEQQITDYLQNKKLPFTTDEFGNVSLLVDKDLTLYFKPEQYPTVFSLMMDLLAYYGEDTGMSEADFANYFKNLILSDEYIRNYVKVTEYYHTKRAARYHFESSANEPVKLGEASYIRTQNKLIREQDQLLLNEIKNIRSKGYVSRGYLISLANSIHLKFGGIKLIDIANPGFYEIIWTYPF